MKTATEMFAYCTEMEFFTGADINFSKKNFEVIENKLNPDEEVLVCFIGIHNRRSVTRNDGFYAYALTNQRFVMAQKKMFGDTFQIITLDHLQKFQLKKELSLDFLEVLAFEGLTPIVITEGEAQKLLSTLNDVVEKLKAPSQKTKKPADKLSAAEQLIKMKELLDAGILTPEEFQKIKADILN